MRRLVVVVAAAMVMASSACDGSDTSKEAELVAGAGGEPGAGASGGDAGMTTAAGAASLGGGGASESGGGAGARAEAGSSTASAGEGPTESGDGGGGNGGEAGAPFIDDPSAEPAIDLEETRFVDYGRLRVAFNRAVDASTLEVTLSPAVPSQLAVTGVTAVNEGTVDVSLSYYHLPRSYELHVVGKLVDATAFDVTAALDGNGARVGFLSKQTGTADFKAWPNVPASLAVERDAADSVCQSEAEAAGFRGKFVAYLSGVDKYDAGCRALGLDGRLSSNCGQPSLPEDDAPWLTPTGLPLVEGASSIIADQWLRPLTFHADGSLAAENEYTWTGTVEGAAAGKREPWLLADCDDWSIGTEGDGHGAYTRAMLSEMLLQYEDPDDYLTESRSCGFTAQLLCLQVGGSFFGPSNLHHVGGKTAFVTEATFASDPTFPTITKIDRACQDEAAAAGLPNATKFRAYVGDDVTDALCHVLKRTGKASNKCGLKAWPEIAWQRTDGLPLGSAEQLASGQLSYPHLMSATGASMLPFEALTAIIGGTPTWGSTHATGARWTNWWSPKGQGYAYCFEGDK